MSENGSERSERTLDSRTRLSARTVLFTVIIVVGVVPFVLERDSFPLSNFPMFSSRRTTIESVDTAVAVSIDGQRQQRLTPSLIAGSDEPVSAAVTVSRSIAAGESQELCVEIVDRIVGASPQWLNEVDAVEIVTETHDALLYFSGDHTPLKRTVHGRCPLGRR